MIKVECDACKAPYQIDEKRVPATGLKMRCPKCGNSIMVQKAGGEAGAADLPAPARPKPPAPPQKPPLPKGPPRPPPRGTVPFGAVDLGDGLEEAVLPDDAPELPDVASAALPAPRKTAPMPTKRPEPTAKAQPPARPVEEPPQQQIGFGQIDLAVDLPSPIDEAGHDLPIVQASRAELPSVQRPRAPEPPPAAARPKAPPPPMRKKTQAFGEIDVDPEPEPAPQQKARPRARTVQFGEIDLPSIADEAGLPAKQPGAPQAKGGGFGEIDLPLVAGAGVDLPSALDAGLPSPAAGLGLPMATQGAGLPTPAQGAGLPMAAQGAGLPTVQGAGLPAHQGAGLPMHQGVGLPTHQGAGLPAHQGAGLPTHQGAGLPAHQGAGLPMHQGVGLPSHQGAGLPSPGGQLPAMYEAGLPAKLEGGADDLFGEDPLEGGHHPSGAGDRVPINDNPFAAGNDPDQLEGVDHPRSGGPRAGIDVDHVGGEAELGAAPMGEAPIAIGAVDRPAPVVQLAKKTSNARKAAIAGLVLLVVAGGSLALLPDMGPFGVNFISDRVNARGHAQALVDLKQRIDQDLDIDTFASDQKALEGARTAQASTPRYKPILAYAAFVAFERQIRFGKRSEDEAWAQSLMQQAGREAGDSGQLAQAAALTVAGNYDTARSIVASLASRLPNDFDVACLAAEIESRAKAFDKAEPLWTQALAIKKGARALYGLAAAEYALGKSDVATKNARAALDASPDHAGARILLAQMLWQSATGEAEALAMLKKVVEDGSSVRLAAGDSDLVAAYTTMGSIHLKRSRMTQAEQAFAAALKLDPLAIDALVGNGELFFSSGRFSEALSRFEAAMKADPTNIGAKIGAAKAMLRLERLKEAKDLLKPLQKEHPKDPTVLLWLGTVEEALANKKEAEANYLEAIKVGGDKEEAVSAYVALAHLYSANGRADDANKKLEEASAKFPNKPALHRAKGEVALAAGRYEDARHELEEALAIDDDLGTRYNLAVALRRMRQFDAAAAAFDKVASIDKDYPGLALERGLLFEETGQSDKALEMYNAALQKAPDDVDLKLRVGSTQVIAGHPEAAEKMLLEVYKVRPNSGEANHFLGRAKLARGQLADAMRYLKRASELDGNRAEYWLYVGWAANEAGDQAQAEAALKRALEIDSELADAYWQRGILRQKQGATDDAIRDLQLALSKRPSRFEAYATLALCYQDKQRWPDAEEAWRKAIAGNDKMPEWHYRLGKILATQGGRQSATPELEKAVQLSDDKSPPAWLFDAHFLVAEAYRGSDKAKAIEHYQAFLKLAPLDNAYRVDAVKALTALGAPPQ